MQLDGLESFSSQWILLDTVLPFDLYVLHESKPELLVKTGEAFTLDHAVKLRTQFADVAFLPKSSISALEKLQAHRHFQSQSSRKRAISRSLINHPGRKPAIQSFLDHAFKSIGWIDGDNSKEAKTEELSRKDLRAYATGDSTAWFFGEARPEEPTFYHDARVAYLTTLLVNHYLANLALNLKEALISGAIVHQIVGAPGEMSSRPDCEPTLDRIRHKDYFVTENVLKIIEQHEEKCDGSGRPRGLKADKIGAGAKVLSLTNEWDHLWCREVGGTRRARKDRCLQQMQARKHEFDPRVFPLFEKLMSRIDYHI